MQTPGQSNLPGGMPTAKAGQPTLPENNRKFAAVCANRVRQGLINYSSDLLRFAQTAFALVRANRVREGLIKVLW
ncbi:hypothetical protein PCASD_11622, partial [Puccinia coronata f. sp. avenae]